MAEKVDPKTLNKNKDVVSIDRNWVYRVNNETAAEEKWPNQWGFYANGLSPERINAQKKDTLEERIKELELEVKKIDSQVFETTSSMYGKGEHVEMFKDKKYNIHENEDLRCLERRLPKGWKKPKWTAPADPFDPLANAGKKK